jgi:hypothetical protein
MTTHKFISDQQPSGIPMDGTYNMGSGIFAFPSGTTAPAISHEGQVIFISPSGRLIVASGSTWVGADFS